MKVYREGHQGNIIFRERLQQKGWTNKTLLYEDCFKSVHLLGEMASPNISIVFISWRLHRNTLKSFETLEKQRGQGFELIFVDNGAQPGEFEILKPYGIRQEHIKINAKFTTHRE